jgi:tetratricopeptide (TPR) repeat protein
MTVARTTLRHLAIAIALAAAACAEMPKTSEPPKPAAPQITEEMLRERAVNELANGVKSYDAGDYDSAVKSLQTSLDHGLLSKVEQARARKYLAFSHCVTGRETLCRDEFRRAFEIYPDFVLSAAEDGHPIWGPIYRSVRTQLVTEREAAEARKPTGFTKLGKAEQILNDGLVKYDSGDYDAALKLFEQAMKEGLKDKADTVRAMKFTAFSLCLKDRYPQCRAEFVKIFDVDAAFDLTPAESGHPSWTKTFAAAKAQAKKDLAGKEAREKAAKDKAATPPAAGVPKK